MRKIFRVQDAGYIRYRNFFGNYVLQGGGGVSFGVAEAFGYRGANTYARSFTVADGKYWLHNLADEPLPAASFPSGAFPGEPEKCAGCPKNKIKV